jgi:NAD+ synthetase
MRIALAQLNLTVGDIPGNEARILAAYERGVAEDVDLVICPELSLTGYPPRDLLLRPAFVRENLAALQRLTSSTGKVGKVGLLLGFVGQNTEEVGRPLTNSAALLYRGEVQGVRSKTLLPTYDVFDEDRYFEPANEMVPLLFKGRRLGVTICEDLWNEEGLVAVRRYRPNPAQVLVEAGAEWIVNLSASPWHLGKETVRHDLLTALARRSGCPVAYCNLVGGNDELIFDGQSLVLDAQGLVLARGNAFAEDFLIVEHHVVGDTEHFDRSGSRSRVVTPKTAGKEPNADRDDSRQSAPEWKPFTELALKEPSGLATESTPIVDVPSAVSDAPSNSKLPDLDLPGARALGAELNTGSPPPEESLYDALVLGTRDFLHKCGFRNALVGLSGGIDSAVVACIAAAALGPGQVHGVAMPSPYSSSGSLADAQALARALSIRYDMIPIGPAFTRICEGLAPVFVGRAEDVTEENLQARLRGVTLMALSNKLGAMVLTTGNKSELAVGYCTLYGDMCGGLAVISDVPKTWIYRLANWINADAAKEGRHPPIPMSTIGKPPSAELRPDQTDQDSLPPYEVLDAILEGYVMDHHSPAELIEQGLPAAAVQQVVRLIDAAEYKRRQSAPGLRVTTKAFGMGRRIPIAQKWREG